jgi:AbrB family looped-hinge helix DNA binding protein
MEAAMNEVTVSPKFQIVIPRNLREAMDIQPGARIQVLRYADRIELIPLKKPQHFRGFLKGIDTSVDRESDRV